mgnify:CR=1 FL=1
MHWKNTIINRLNSDMDKLKSIDSKPSNVRLNVGGVSEYKTKTGGFLNLIYILIGLSIFFAKIMSIV